MPERHQKAQEHETTEGFEHDKTRRRLKNGGKETIVANIRNHMKINSDNINMTPTDSACKIFGGKWKTMWLFDRRFDFVQIGLICEVVTEDNANRMRHR